MKGFQAREESPALQRDYRIQSASESGPLTVIKTILPSFGWRREDVDE